jgi:cytoskeletal protein CcmA (bactofilin family)
MDVGGSVRLRGNSSGGRIDVGGLLNVSGNLKFEDIDVGGTVDIDGDAEGNDIDVGGVLKVSGNLTLTGDLEVGGRCRIDQVLTADRIEIGGSLEADLVKVDKFEAGGSTLSKRGVRATSIIVADRGRVRGPLFGDSIRLGEKADVEAVYGKSIVLEEKCRCTLLHGVDVRIQSGCRILGEVFYSGSLEAEEDVLFAVAPKKVDVLPAEPA